MKNLILIIDDDKTLPPMFSAVIDNMSCLNIKPMNFTPSVETLQQLIAEQTTELRKIHKQLQQEVVERQRAEAALQQAQNQLEIKVEERTAALSRANSWFRKEFSARTKSEVEIRRRLAGLEQQLIERTQELEAVNQQLQWEISEHKLLEEKLHSSEVQIRAIFEAMSDIVFIIDERTSFIKVAPTTPALLSESVVGIIEQTVNQLIEGEQTQTFLGQIQQVLETQQPLDFEYSLPLGNAEAWFLARIAPFTSDSVIWVARDITKRKEAEEALRKLSLLEQERATQLKFALQELQHTQAQLVQNEKMASLGQLVAGVAHEINNPTSFIYGNINPASEYAQDLLYLLKLYAEHYPQPVAEIAEQLESIDPDFIAEDFPKLLASMKEGAERICEIVLSLKNFSRLDEADRKQVDIHEGIDNTLLILQHRLKQKPGCSEIQVIKEYGQLPRVECYPGQLNQLFMNLLSNAIDALEEARGSDTPNVATTALSTMNHEQSCNEQSPLIRIHTQLFDSNQVVIHIADNGAGMTADVHSRIFDPFFTTKPPGHGTGLGLSISYKIVVDKHGGQLTCHSVVGQGTEFAIELPIAQNIQLAKEDVK